MIESERFSVYKNWRVRAGDLSVTNSELPNFVATESEHLVIGCEESSMVVSARQLLDYYVKGERIRHMICNLFHFFIPVRVIVLREALLAILVGTPAEELGVLECFLIVSWLKLKAFLIFL